MNRYWIAFSAVLCTVILLSGCRFSSNPTQSVTALPPPHLTLVTAVPAHNWQSGPVLAMFSIEGCPDSCYNEFFSMPPEIVLYADGRQIIYDQSHLFERDLTHTTVCGLLNNIDRTGFFEIDSEQYQNDFKKLPPGPFVSYFLGVYGWKSNSMHLPDFKLFLNGSHSGEIAIPPALAETYRMLTDYDVAQLKPYQPEQLALFIRKESLDGYRPDFAPLTWKPTSVSLADLTERYLAAGKTQGSDGEIIISGDEAQTIWGEFQKDPWSGLKVYKEGNEIYGVAIRALLPYETTGGNIYGMTQVLSLNTVQSLIPISCS